MTETLSDNQKQNGAQIQTVEPVLKYPHRKSKRRVASAGRTSALTASEIHTGLLLVAQLRDIIGK